MDSDVEKKNNKKTKTNKQTKSMRSRSSSQSSSQLKRKATLKLNQYSEQWNSLRKVNPPTRKTKAKQNQSI